jgi:prepilin-type N-terminal cleavage/methylation domain-containing protein
MHDSRSSSLGMTLIEVMVVLAIIALTLTIALPNLRMYNVRSRLIGPARDIENLAAVARLQAVNNRGFGVLAFHVAGASDEFSRAEFAGANAAVVFLDHNPSNAVDPTDGNGQWDASSSEPIVSVYPLPIEIAFKRPGGGDPVINASWTLGSPAVTTSDRIVFGPTGAMAQARGADPIAFVGDGLGNFIRLRFSYITGQVVREKNVPGTNTWLGDVVRGKWVWAY